MEKPPPVSIPPVTFTQPTLHSVSSNNSPVASLGDELGKMTMQTSRTPDDFVLVAIFVPGLHSTENVFDNMVDSLKKEFPSHRRRPTLLVNRANDITVAENPEELAMRLAREKMSGSMPQDHSDDEDTRLGLSTTGTRSRQVSGESTVSMGGIVSHTNDPWTPNSMPYTPGPTLKSDGYPVESLNSPPQTQPIPFPAYDSLPRTQEEDYDKNEVDYHNVRPTVPLDQTIKEEAQARHHLFTLHAKTTRGPNATAGIARCGSELAHEIENYFNQVVFAELKQYLDEIRAERGGRYIRSRERKFRIHFSLIGHGLGGLVAKYAAGILLCGPGTPGQYDVPMGDDYPLNVDISNTPMTPASPYAQVDGLGTHQGILGRLVREQPDLVTFILPTSFISIATPHLGIKRPPGLASFSKSVSSAFSHNKDSQSVKELMFEDDKRNPMLVRLSNPKSIFMKALLMFKHRTLVGVVKNDKEVSFCSSMIRTTHPFTNPKDIDFGSADGARLVGYSGFYSPQTNPADDASLLRDPERNYYHRTLISARVYPQVVVQGFTRHERQPVLWVNGTNPPDLVLPKEYPNIVRDLNTATYRRLSMRIRISNQLFASQTHKLVVGWEPPLVPDLVLGTARRSADFLSGLVLTDYIWEGAEKRRWSQTFPQMLSTVISGREMTPREKRIKMKLMGMGAFKQELAKNQASLPAIPPPT